MRSVSKSKKRSREQGAGNVTVVKGGSYFSSDSLRLIFQSAATRDLHAVQGVSHQFKKLAQEELQSRCGLIYQISGDALISQVRICFDNKKQIALEVKSKNQKLPIMLPIKNKKSILDGNDDIFFLSDNPLGIRRIIASNDYTRDICVDFLHDKPSMNLKYSPNIEPVVFQPTEGEVKLIEAIKANDTPTVMALLTTKVSPNTRDCEGIPVLVSAASHGDLENVKLLVAHGANLENRSAKGGRTALLIAGGRIGSRSSFATLHEYNQKAVIRFLIESGARVDAQSKTGKTILHYLSQTRIDNTKEISFLLSRGADPTQVDLFDRCPTDVAARPGDFFSKNMQVLYMATIHITPALYCSHWSQLKDGSAYSIHFKSGVLSNKKLRTMDAFASKVKSVKTDDPIAGGLGLANDEVNFQLPGCIAIPGCFATHNGDLPIPKCDRYAVFAIRGNEEESCMTLFLDKKYKDNTFVHAAIKKMFQELKLTKTPMQKKSRSVYESQLTQFKPESSSYADDTSSLKKSKTTQYKPKI